MKTIKSIILASSFAMLLSSCSSGSNVVYKLTFHQETGEDKVVEVVKGKTTNEDVKNQEPAITPKDGYNQAWVYDVTTMTEDTIITPTSSLITYFATFKADGVQVGERLAFNVETTELDEPLVPLKDGYYGFWEEYKIAASDLTINAVYSLISFKATFVADGVPVGDPVTFDKNTTSINEPNIPQKAGYTAEWESYELGLKDIVINAIYTPITYYATFKADGVPVGDPVPFNLDQEKINEPEVPNKPGYDGSWESYKMKPEDMVINAQYALKTYYATFMADGVQVGSPVPFTVETQSINEPNVPQKAGYNAKWSSYTLGTEDITINAEYTTITYHAYFYDKNEQQVGSPVEFTVESKSINEPPVPHVDGYDGKWENYQIKAEDLHIHPVYELETYKAIFKDGDTTLGVVEYNINDTVATVLDKAPIIPVKVNYSRDYGKFNLTYKKDVDTIIQVVEAKTIIDFEDSIIPTSFVNNNIVSEVKITNDGVEGSKSLEISVKAGDFKFGLDKNHLDLLFKDNEVAAVAFDAKASKASQNWRYDTPQGEPSASASQPYEDYEVGAGIATSYKTFYFTRKMYNSWVENESYMVKGALDGVEKVYVDNFRTVDYDIYNNKKQYGFETNTLKKTAANAVSVRIGSGKQAMSISGAGVVEDSWSYSYDNKTEGNRSIKFKKQSGYLAIYLDTSIISQIPGDYVVFDLFTTVGFNSTDDNKGMSTGQSGVINNQKPTPNSKWFTLSFKKFKSESDKGDITSDGRLLQIQGSPACDVYIDNIRGIDAIDGFESAYAFKAGEYGYGLDYKTEHTEAAGNTIRDVNKNYSFMVNSGACTNAEISMDNVLNGHKSIKYTFSAKKYCALFINPQLLDIYLPKGFSISFDIFSSTSFTGGTLMGNAVNSHIGEWTTVTLTEENFERASSGNLIYNGRFSQANFNDAGYFYIDNLRLVPPTLAA